MDKSCACQGKNLEKFIQPVILSALEKQGAQTGYQLVRAIGGYATFSDGAPDPTGVYRYLRNLEAKGCLSREADGRWQLTEAGSLCLISWRQTVCDYAATLAALAEEL